MFTSVNEEETPRVLKKITEELLSSVPTNDLCLRRVATRSVPGCDHVRHDHCRAHRTRRMHVTGRKIVWWSRSKSILTCVSVSLSFGGRRPVNRSRPVRPESGTGDRETSYLGPEQARQGKQRRGPYPHHCTKRQRSEEGEVSPVPHDRKRWVRELVEGPGTPTVVGAVEGRGHRPGSIRES